MQFSATEIAPVHTSTVVLSNIRYRVAQSGANLLVGEFPSNYMNLKIPLKIPDCREINTISRHMFKA